MTAEVEALAEAETAVERTQRALSEGVARCLSLGLDEATTQRTVADLQQRYQAAVRHRVMVLAIRQQTTDQERRVAQVHELAAVARERLVHADRTMQAQVLALLDVRVTVLDHAHDGQPVRVRVEGSVAHDLLLLSAESDWKPVAPGMRAGGAG